MSGNAKPLLGIFQLGEEALLLPLSENNETVDLCALVSLVAKLMEPDPITLDTSMMPSISYPNPLDRYRALRSSQYVPTLKLQNA